MTTFLQGTGEALSAVVISWLTVVHYSSSGIALTTLAYALPYITLVFFGGIYSDSYNKRNLYLITLLSFFVGAFALTTVSVFMTPPLWFLVLFNFVNAAIGAYYWPNQAAIVSQLAGDGHVVTSQQLFTVQYAFCGTVGAILAGFLMEYGHKLGPNSNGQISFLLYTLCYLPIIVSILRLRKADFDTAHQTLKIDAIFSTIFLSIRDAIKYITANENIKTLAITLLLMNLLGLSYQPLLSIFASDHLSIPRTHIFYSQISAAVGIGSLIGGLISFWFIAHKKYAGLAIALCMPGLFLGVLGYLFSSSLYAILILLVFTSCCGSIFLGLNFDYIEKLSADEMRGRMSAIYEFSIGISILGGSIMSAVIKFLSNSQPHEFHNLLLVQISIITLLAISTLYMSPSLLRLVKNLRPQN